jgi:hypothetical protein
MDNFEDLTGDLGDALHAIRHEFLSIDLLTQFSLILLAAAAAALMAMLARPRIDLTGITMGWPPLLRLWLRRLTANLGVLIFALLLILERAVMLAVTSPGRSSLTSRSNRAMSSPSGTASDGSARWGPVLRPCGPATGTSFSFQTRISSPSR